MDDHSVRFEDLIERHHDEIYTYVWRLLDGASGSSEHSHEAADIVQDAFERAYKAFPRLRCGSNYRAWLYKIATNCAYTVMRRTKRGTSLDGDGGDDWLADSGPGPEQSTVYAEDLNALHLSITCLPPSQKAALVMRYLHGLDYSEIAAALACSEESARANVSHALRRLRSGFAERIAELERF